MNTKYEKIAGAISEDQLDELIKKEHISGATTPACIVAVIGATGAIIAATLGSGNCPTAKCGQGGRRGGHRK